MHASQVVAPLVIVVSAIVAAACGTAAGPSAGVSAEPSAASPLASQAPTATPQASIGTPFAVLQVPAYRAFRRPAEAGWSIAVSVFAPLGNVTEARAERSERLGGSAPIILPVDGAPDTWIVRWAANPCPMPAQVHVEHEPNGSNIVVVVVNPAGDPFRCAVGEMVEYDVLLRISSGVAPGGPSVIDAPTYPSWIEPGA